MEKIERIKITLTPEDVESAIRAFICKCHPEYEKGYVINPKYSGRTIEITNTFECSKEIVD